MGDSDIPNVQQAYAALLAANSGTMNMRPMAISQAAAVLQAAAALEVAAALGTATTALDEGVFALTTVIENSSKASSGLGARLLYLNIVLTAATVVAAVATVAALWK